jgi:uncharacterized protein (DUF362 family)
MNSFLKIKTVFDHKTERTVQDLSKCYSDKELLRSVVRELIEETLLKDGFLNDKKVLIKPNWVLQDIQPHDDISLRTNENLLLALISVLLDYAPKAIVIGDAPIQGCIWEKMLKPFFITEIESLSKKFDIPIIIKDFRRVVLDTANNILTTEKNPITEYLIFDVGKGSYLEPISSDENNFRVTCYDPDMLAESHRKGMHKYCITKEVFEADVVISVPKLKTHQKTGITGALKNLVGINGDKAYLPHHRIGGVDNGGDCYPDKNILRLWAEKCADLANRKIGKPQYTIWLAISMLFWKLSNPKNVHQMAAGWHGNDTCWRMVMDLNKVAIYGKKDGTLAIEPQRVLYTLCDGIIGGQGNGPLEPIPLPLGFVGFSNSSPLTDICTATLMGFDINKISLLKSANQQIQSENIEIILNQNKVLIDDLKKLAIKTIPPPGWSDHL